MRRGDVLSSFLRLFFSLSETWISLEYAEKIAAQFFFQSGLAFLFDKCLNLIYTPDSAFYKFLTKIRLLETI